MKFSCAFIKTLKEAPKEAVLPSHIYLVRGGFIAQVSSGIYNFLPLGKRVLEKIKNIIREELDSSGAMEVQLGFVTPCSLWERSGRLKKFGKELLKFRDRKDNCYVLGPTHEEMVVELVKNRVKSYKELPLNLYQIHLKFRDEIRPRFGLLRGREFVMKDGYSFHSTYEDMVREYNLMEDVYAKIFKRIKLDFKIVEASVGAIGGSGSKEFMVLAESGEDKIAFCKKCDYAANVETAKKIRKKIELQKPQFSGFVKFYTPGVTTIEELSEFFKVSSYFLMKAVVKKAVYEDKKEIVVFFLRGCDKLQETKAQNFLKAVELLDPTEEEIQEANLITGFIGPFDLKTKAIFDENLKGDDLFICGANEKDYHFIGCDISKIENAVFGDIVEIEEGDLCPKCNSEITIKKGIEVAHIFCLGTRYSEPLDAVFLDKDGKQKPFVMGTYGIGVSRLVSAIIEQNHDDKGCIWPIDVAPYQVEILISNVKNPYQREFGETLYDELLKNSVEVILDDRDERFGFKIKDFELIGFPYCIVIGKKLEDGFVEIITRDGLKKEFVAKESAVDFIMEKLR